MSRPSPSILLNGRFLSFGPTGVARVARQLVRHMDRVMAADPQPGAEPWTLLCPRDATRPLELEVVTRRRIGITTWQLWEQVELARFARRGLLVNLCNTAPLMDLGGVTLIHDAQVFLSLESYSRAFRAWYKYALPRIGSAAARIVTVSNYSRDRLVEYGVARAEKISVVPNGVDHFAGIVTDAAVMTRLGLKPGAFVLAAAGAQKHKNLGVLFDAFRSPALGRLALVVAGADGADAFIASGARPPPRALFAGRTSDGELRALYENALCLAFPSTTEGFGLPPMEAMSLGCPAVVAPCGALPEVCGDAATYAAPDDPCAWVEAIVQLSEDAGARTRAKAAGQARAALFRWEDSARRFVDIVRDVARRD